MQPSQIPSYGAVDLSGLTRRPAPGGPGDSGDAGSFVVDVTEETFQREVAERSLTTPVVLDLWAEWCEPCKQLSPILERLAAADGGRWILAKVDVDANQRIALGLGVQGIPAVNAVVAGQVVAEFNGVMPEPQVRQWLDEVLRLADQASPPGAAGAGPGGEAGDPAAAVESPSQAALVEAMEAARAGDLDRAAAGFAAILDRDPGEGAAKGGLAQVELIRRARQLDPGAVRKAAAQRPDDPKAQIQAADLDMAGGHVEDAFSRLVDAVARTHGADREKVRLHLIGLFDILPPDDPRVSRVRIALARILF